MLVTGAPGAGKTSLARPLAKALGFALLSKDDIKEPLFDALGGVVGDLAQSRKIGAASWGVLWSLASTCPRVVLEANFRPSSTYERQRLLGLAGEIVEVYCRCPPAEAARRYTERARTAARHAAHAAMPVISEADVRAEYGRPIGVGRMIEVDTTMEVDVTALAVAIEESWTNP